MLQSGIKVSFYLYCRTVGDKYKITLIVNLSKPNPPRCLPACVPDPPSRKRSGDQARRQANNSGDLVWQINASGHFVYVCLHTIVMSPLRVLRWLDADVLFNISFRLLDMTNWWVKLWLIISLDGTCWLYWMILWLLQGQVCLISVVDLIK